MMVVITILSLKVERISNLKGLNFYCLKEMTLIVLLVPTEYDYEQRRYVLIRILMF